MSKLLILCAFSAFSLIGGDLERAQVLYDRADYEGALRLLASQQTPAALELAGRCAYMVADFKKAADFFERAVAAEPDSASHSLWLGRALGRRAETSNPLSAPGLATKARKAFERAVELDPRNSAAVDDLLSYYLEAPGFLGGGLDKASALAARIQNVDAAAYNHAQARIAIERKQFDAAERYLRKAIELAPKNVARLVDLAQVLAKSGRFPESDQAFQQAATLAPSSPDVIYSRAQTLIESKRNLELAKQLLERYLRLPLTPDNASRDDARRLLKQATGG